jgi:hypothetical protein
VNNRGERVRERDSAMNINTEKKKERLDTVPSADYLIQGGMSSAYLTVQQTELGPSGPVGFLTPT